MSRAELAGELTRLASVVLGRRITIERDHPDLIETETALRIGLTRLLREVEAGPITEAERA